MALAVPALVGVATPMQGSLRIVCNIFPLDVVLGLGSLIVGGCPPFLLTDREVDVSSPLPKPLPA